jgi:hypothetical protein
VYHARTKRIEIDRYFMREKVLSHDIILKLISTHDQIADIFTKGLSSTRFLQLGSKLMMDSTPISLKGANREPSPAKPSLLTAQSKSSPTQSTDCGIRQAPAHSTDCGSRQATTYHAPLIKPCNPLDLGNPYQSRSCTPELRKPYQRSHSFSATCLAQNDTPPLLNLRA